MTNLPCVAQQHPNQHVVYSLECTPNPELVEKLWSLLYNEKEDLDRSMDVSEKEKNERINRINVIERLEKKILSDKRYTPADVAEFNTLCGKVLEDRAQTFALIRARHVVDFQENVEKLSSIKAGHRIHEIHKGAALAPRDLMLDLIQHGGFLKEPSGTEEIKKLQESIDNFKNTSMKQWSSEIAAAHNESQKDARGITNATGLSGAIRRGQERKQRIRGVQLHTSPNAPNVPDDLGRSRRAPLRRGLPLSMSLASFRSSS